MIVVSMSILLSQFVPPSTCTTMSTSHSLLSSSVPFFSIPYICINITSSLLIIKYLVFNWRIIALQYCFGFCQTSTWISHRYTYVPSLLNLPPYPTPLGCYRAPVWVPWVIQQIPLAICFTCICNVYVLCYSLHTCHPLLPPHPTALCL